MEYISTANECRPHEVDLPFACGSGSDYAIGAMLAGKSPREAVELAAKKNSATGGKIMEMKI